jgi:hypothetical protein
MVPNNTELNAAALWHPSSKSRLRSALRRGNCSVIKFRLHRSNIFPCAALNEAQRVFGYLAALYSCNDADQHHHEADDVRIGPGNIGYSAEAMTLSSMIGEIAATAARRALRVLDHSSAQYHMTGSATIVTRCPLDPCSDRPAAQSQQRDQSAGLSARNAASCAGAGAGMP